MLSGLPVTAVRRWRSLNEKSRMSDCIVLDLPELNTRICRDLSALRILRPLIQIIVLTEFQQSNLGHLAYVQVNGVLPTDAVDQRLVDLVRDRLRAGPLDPIASLFEASLTLNPELKAAFSAMFRTFPPLRSVKALSNAIECDRRRLASWWRAYVSPRTGLRLKDALGAVLVFHAIRLRRSHENWSVVAAQIGIDPRTLARISSRVFGATLNQLFAEGVYAFERRLVNLFPMPLFEEPGVNSFRLSG
jgi:hypothetical protein